MHLRVLKCCGAFTMTRLVSMLWVVSFLLKRPFGAKAPLLGDARTPEIRLQTYGAKKKAAHNERQREIRSANVGFIKRFASIISTPTEFEVAAVEHKIRNSKNIIGARREQRRINAANAYHAERLRKLNPCYSSKKWDKDRMDQLVFLKRHMKDFSLLDQKSKCAALEPEPLDVGNISSSRCLVQAAGSHDARAGGQSSVGCGKGEAPVGAEGSRFGCIGVGQNAKAGQDEG